MHATRSAFPCRPVAGASTAHSLTIQSTVSLWDHLTMRMDDRSLLVLPPILRDKHDSAPSAFTPESLLREARRQRDVPDTSVPGICILACGPPASLADFQGTHARTTAHTRRTSTVYGDPPSPSLEDLRARGKSWNDIIESAARPGYSPPDSSFPGRSMEV